MRKQGFRILLGALGLFMTVSVYGQIYFGITPIRAEHAGKAGQGFTDVFQIRNNDKSPIRIKVYVENWTLQRDGVPSFIGAEPTTYSCKDWIKVNPQDFRLLPNEIKAVRYTTTIPSEIPPGGYHAAVSFESVSDPKSPKAGSRMVFSGKIAAAVYIKVGTVPVEGDVTDIKFSRTDSSQAIILVMKNMGKTHFRTKGEIEIFDSGDNKIMRLEAPNEVVLPESEREISCSLSKALDPGVYRAVCRLDIGRPEILGLEKAIKVEQ